MLLHLPVAVQEAALVGICISLLQLCWRRKMLLKQESSRCCGTVQPFNDLLLGSWREATLRAQQPRTHGLYAGYTVPCVQWLQSPVLQQPLDPGASLDHVPYLGPATAAKLRDVGITTFNQLYGLYLFTRYQQQQHDDRLHKNTFWHWLQVLGIKHMNVIITVLQRLADDEQ